MFEFDAASAYKTSATRTVAYHELMDPLGTRLALHIALLGATWELNRRGTGEW